jgi:2-polyprenyl-3-methyl-5-hydroxy-6-metoxy-1,4-benzoquinol methylase
MNEMNLQDSYLHRLCPSCGSAAPETPEVSSPMRAESMDLQTLAPHWDGFFKEKVFFSYHRCNTCGLLFNKVFFTPAQLGELYGRMAPNMELVPVEALRKTQRGYFNQLKAHSELRGAFIEIGPDVGLFTENCVREGAFDEYWLFEPNVDVAPALAKTVHGKKHHVVHEMFGFDCVPDNTVSVVVMIHVFDHLLDPVQTLKELRTKLSPDAKVLIVTHDESSLLRKVVKWRWPAFCLQHPQIYNPTSIERILVAAGFELVAQKKTTNYFPVAFLVKHLLWAFGLKVKKVPGFFGLQIGLKLGNLSTIAKPKKG